MNQIIIIRDINGVVPYWAADETLPLARKRYKRLTGKFPSAKASILAFRCDIDPSLLDRIVVTDLGDIVVPRDVVKIVIQ